MNNAFGQRRGRHRSPALIEALGEFQVPEASGDGGFPVVLAGAAGARVRDADGNRYIDMTSFFGACLAGHRNRAVITAARGALGHLVHCMGDVHPEESRIRLLKLLASMMPEAGYRGLLSQNGADAVETALKFAAAATGRGGVIAFDGAYHGLAGSALEVTARETFRKPFDAVLSGRAVFAPWPSPDGSDLDAILDAVLRLAKKPVVNRWGIDIGQPGALIIEPVQGRGGMRVPPAGFLRGLADICRDAGIVFITDEIYSGTFRTGQFLAGDVEGISPDVICLGKALGGGFPISAAMMKPAVAEAVACDHGEAVHTSTFMGWPVACRAAAASIAELRRMHPGAQASRIEGAVRAAADGWAAKFPFVNGVCGRGAMLGIRISDRSGDGTVMKIVGESLRMGLIVLPEGPGPDVIALTPPLSIPDADLEGGLRILGRAMEAVAG